MRRHVPAPPAPKRLFVFGFGYSAAALAARLKPRGWRIAGTRRTPAGADEMAARGYAGFVFDGTGPLAGAAEALAGATHVLHSVPPDKAGGDPVLAHHRGELAALAGLKWAGYLSTTGVYGDRGGEWVDEKTGLHPSGPRGRARVADEQSWLELLRLGLPAHVFRIAGIYGPGRSALDAVRGGRARRIVKPGQVFSRIQVDDLAAALEASMAQPNPGGVYNVCDDEPAPPQDVIAYACALLGREAPPEIPFAAAQAGMSEMARSFYDESKRVANRRIKDELGVKLAFPDYRAGLKALLAAEEKMSSRT